MKSTILRYGTFSAIFIVVFFLITWLVFQAGEDYAIQEILGYVGIIIALSFVYFGIRHFRDKKNGGRLSFGEGMKLGTIMTLIPALTFAILDWVYVTFFDPQFYEKYSAYMQKEMKRTLSAAEYQAKLIQMEAEKEMFSNPVIAILVMFLTVFLIGVIVAVLSSLILKRKNNTATYRSS